MNSYADAPNHYLPPARRDPVKRFWEEPVNHAVLSRAVRSLASQPEAPLRVLDVGAGTGDGLALLDAALRGTGLSNEIRYHGLDLDPDMVRTAKELHHDRDAVEFTEGDIRTDLPGDPFDLYLSAGVPYSHLTTDELSAALAGIFGAVARNRTRSAVVVDVLGRYSPEWEPHWAHRRWDYDTSFFHGTAPIAMPMTVHTGQSLRDLLCTAAATAGLTVRHLELADRAVLVGRHTATGAFAPGITPYRDLVNRLYDGDTTVDFAALTAPRPATAAPADVHAFFTALATAWDRTVADTADLETTLGAATPDTRRTLAAALRRTEHGLTRGLGVGHTLIAVATVGP